jgi:hypothetical protein
MSMNRRNVLIATAAMPLLSGAVEMIAARPAIAAAPDFSGVKTIAQFANQVVGRAVLSEAACKVAVKKATRADAREFAGLELMEATLVLSILKDLGTPIPALQGDAEAALNAIVDQKEGVDFDRAYIGAEYQNHVVLRNLAHAYLTNSDPHPTDAQEYQGRQIASLAHFAFTEHTVITHRIAMELGV